MATEQRHGRSVPVSALARPTEQQADPALCLMRLPAKVAAVARRISCKETAPRAATLLALLCRFPAGPGLRCPNGRVLTAGWRRSGRRRARPRSAGAARAGAATSRASRPRPGRRAPVAVVRGDLGRRGRRRRGGLAEGGRDERVEFIAEPLRVGADQIRERGVRFDVARSMPITPPGTFGSVARSMTDTLFI